MMRVLGCVPPLLVIVLAVGPGAANAADTRFTFFSGPISESNAYYKCMADLDGDGLDDLIVGARIGGSQKWYRSNGNDTWTEHLLDPDGDTTSGGACGDIDGDGDIDVFIGRTVYYNPSIGGPGSVIRVWTNRSLVNGLFHDARLADVDGDGKIDVIGLIGESNTQAIVNYQDTPFAWTSIDLDAGFGRNGLQVADVDLDGKVDVIVSRHWFKNPGNRVDPWPIFSHNDFWPEYSAISSADMNGDGRTDILLTQSENGTSIPMWLENPPDPTAVSNWTTHQIGTISADSCHQVWGVDIDKDGLLDVVTSEFRRPFRVLIYHGENNFGTAFQTQIVANVEIHNLAIGDYDADGDMDLFGTRTFAAAPLSIFRNDTPLGGQRQDFVRGDANANLSFDVSDPIKILDVLFLGGTAPCLVALDANDDELVDLADALYALAALFEMAPIPPAPFPGCGADPTVGPLPCDGFAVCP